MVECARCVQNLIERMNCVANEILIVVQAQQIENSTFLSALSQRRLFCSFSQPALAHFSKSKMVEIITTQNYTCCEKGLWVICIHSIERWRRRRRLQLLYAEWALACVHSAFRHCAILHCIFSPNYTVLCFFPFFSSFHSCFRLASLQSSDEHFISAQMRNAVAPILLFMASGYLCHDSRYFTFALLTFSRFGFSYLIVVFGSKAISSVSKRNQPNIWKSWFRQFYIIIFFLRSRFATNQ